ncbi:hypothetical protein [Acinetobacter sp. G11]|uniref:hypothetical protein n=1 Tax=Acinetobacter sp. G11 TaxID=3415989 RepID=UPI003C7B7695
MNKGDRIKVDFVSESCTEFSGNHFTGEGVVDRVEDGRVPERGLIDHHCFTFGTWFRIKADLAHEKARNKFEQEYMERTTCLHNKRGEHE